MIALTILALASVARVALLSLPIVWSKADETVMARLALKAAAPGYSYRRACEEWIRDPANARWPGMVRFAAIFLVAALYRITRRNTYYVPAATQTAAGIASLWLAWFLACRMFPGSEIAAALVLAASPLQLHLGRRALQDMGVCALTLAALSALLAAPWFTVVPLALLPAYKETSLPVWLPVAAFAWWVGVPPLTILAILTVAGALYWGAWTALTRRPFFLLTFARFGAAARLDSYGREQEGAPHRLLVDLFLLGPVAFICAARSDWSPALGFVLAFVAIQSCIPILRCVRMVTAADAMMRVAVCAVAPWWLAALVLATDLIVFGRVFVRAGTYDPITKNLVAALGMSGPVS